jgi:hypothetical protein
VTAHPLNNASQPAAFPPSHRLRISRSDDDLAIPRGIDLPVAGTVRLPKPCFADGPAEPMQQTVGEIDGGGGFHGGLVIAISASGPTC